MARMVKELGRNRDLPQLEALNFAGAAAGSAADFEHIVAVLTDLTQGQPAGTNMFGATNNGMTVRNLTLCWEAAITGVVTNNFTLNVNQYRAGALLVNTTSATTVIASTMAVTPASMANIFVGTQLVFSGGTGATETVTVQSVTGTTFTATFANGHSSAYTITSAPLATITYASGTNAVKWVPITLTVQKTNYVKGGDILTVARVSSNATGLASPVGLLSIDWVNAGPQ